MSIEEFRFSEDKAWMAERKSQWRQIKRSLDVLSSTYPKFKLKHHKYHQELFLYGRLNPECRGEFVDDPNDAGFLATGGAPFVYMLPVFIIWYHPEPTKLDLKELLQGYIKYAQVPMQRRDFFDTFVNGTYPGANMYPGDYGMMGGREFLCAQFLLPGLDYQESISTSDYTKEVPACSHPREVERWCVRDTTRELFADARFCPYAPGQYLWRHLSYAFEHYPNEMLSPSDHRQTHDQIRSKFLTLLAEILSFEQRTDRSRNRPSTITMVDQLIGQYERKEFSDALVKLWDEAKKNLKQLKEAKLIDFHLTEEFIAEEYEDLVPVDVLKERVSQWKQV